MPKRKLDEISGAKAIRHAAPSKAIRLQQRQLEGLLEQGKKALFRSLKIARGSERQKLGRRQKTAKAESNDANISRLDTEVAALKSLDLAITAELHLYKALLKTKTIASSPLIPRYVPKTVETSRKDLDAASANVQARLFKSNPVHQAFTKSLTDIRTLLGIEENGSSSKKRMRAKDYANASASEEKGRSPANPNANGAPKSASSTEDEWDGLSSSQDYQRPPESEGSDSDHEDFSIYDSRLAATSDDDSELNDSESDHLQEAENLDPESITETDTPDSDPPRTLNPPKKQRPPRPTPKPTKSTTFLPSLSTSGYISASDSTASSLSDSAPAGRKNRMGQQARRALWEKKFGSGARHLKMGGGDRDEGWDVRRGARGGDARGKRGRGRGGGDRGRGSGRERKGGSGRGPVSSGANSETVGVKKAKLTAGAGALHPSWEAAKRAKEQKNTAPFQGKKVVFD